MRNETNELSFADIEAARLASGCKTVEELFYHLAQPANITRQRAKADYGRYRTQMLEHRPYNNPPGYLFKGVQALTSGRSQPRYQQDGHRRKANAEARA